VKFPSASKVIQEFGNELIACGFEYTGLDSRGHLTFLTPGGERYTLSSTPKGTFSKRIERARAFKLAGISAAPKRSTHNVKARREKQRDIEREKSLAQAIATAERKSHLDNLIALEERRRELRAIHQLMGARGPIPF
jgi:hypothetical protein